MTAGGPPLNPENFAAPTLWQRAAKVGRNSLAIVLTVGAAGGNVVSALAQQAGGPAGSVGTPIEQTGQVSDCTLLADMDGPTPSPIDCGQIQLPAKCASPTARLQMHDFTYQPDWLVFGHTVVDNRAFSTTLAANIKPHLRLGYEEDGGVVKNDQQHGAADLALAGMAGGTEFRVVVRASRWQYENRRRGLDNAVKAMEACDDIIQFTLVDDRPGFKMSRYRQFVKQLVERYKDDIDSIAPWNEPNLSGWLKPLPHKSLPQTYAMIHYAAYKVINKLDPNMDVVGFDVSGLEHPLVFIDRAARAYQKLQKGPGQKQPMLMNELGYHPYCSDWPKNRALELGQHPPTNAKEICVTGMPTVEAKVHYLNRARLIVTPNGQPLHIKVDELGIPVANTGPLRYRNTTDTWRTRDEVNILNYFCHRGIYSGYIRYMIDNTAPPTPGYPRNNWDTGLINRQGKFSHTLNVSRTYYGIQHWYETNANTCLQ